VPVMLVMLVTPMMPSTHGVEFRIDQFTHFTHDFDPRGVCVNNIWLKASQRHSGGLFVPWCRLRRFFTAWGSKPAMVRRPNIERFRIPVRKLEQLNAAA
jgi:hypothetical protein